MNLVTILLSNKIFQFLISLNYYFIYPYSSIEYANQVLLNLKKSSGIKLSVNPLLNFYNFYNLTSSRYELTYWPYMMLISNFVYFWSKSNKFWIVFVQQFARRMLSLFYNFSVIESFLVNSPFFTDLFDNDYESELYSIIFWILSSFIDDFTLKLSSLLALSESKNSLDNPLILTLGTLLSLSEQHLVKFDWFNGPLFFKDSDLSLYGPFDFFVSTSFLWWRMLMISMFGCEYLRSFFLSKLFCGLIKLGSLVMLVSFWRVWNLLFLVSDSIIGMFKKLFSLLCFEGLYGICYLDLCKYFDFDLLTPCSIGNLLIVTCNLLSWFCKNAVPWVCLLFLLLIFGETIFLLSSFTSFSDINANSLLFLIENFGNDVNVLLILFSQIKYLRFVGTFICWLITEFCIYWCVFSKLNLY